MTATGSFFTPGESVILLFNGAQADMQTANTGGTVNFQFSVPALAPGDYPVVAVGQSRAAPGLTFTIAGSVLTLSTEQGPPGTSVTVTGNGFQPGEIVRVTFNGAPLDSPVADTTGAIKSTFVVPTIDPGNYNVDAVGQTSGQTSSVSFTVGGNTLVLSPTSGPVDTSVTAKGTGFIPGDIVQLIFNGSLVDVQSADTNGAASFVMTIPRVAAGTYATIMRGQNGGSATAAFAVTAPEPAPVPVPVPTTTPQAAPPMAHDARYFAQTGFRIDNDAVYAFFQANGDVQTFGYPTSRTFSFIGCPVQFFQRQIIQVCNGQGAALLNILDPGIFPYTKVNGSTFPGPDDAMKASTPPVSDPNYDANISAFITANVPNTFNAQSVNFYDYFYSQGGLTIWGAPISHPAPDPSNASFIYQRFQRGIMHFIQGTGTESILVADYLKSLIMDQNVPLDLRAEATAQESPYLKSYCPGAPLWMCTPNQVPGTDYTFAFVPG